MPDSTEPRRTPWPLLLLAIVVIPLLIALIAMFASHKSVEGALAPRAQAALDAAVPGAKVNLSGQTATVTGVPAGMQDTARNAVAGVDGISHVDVTGGGGTGGNSGGSANTSANNSATGSASDVGGSSGNSAGAPVTATVAGDKITLTGKVPDDATKQQLGAAAKAGAGSRTVDNELQVSSGAAKPSSIQLRGSVPTAADKTALGEKVKAGLPSGTTVDNMLTVGGGTVDKASLQRQINQLLAAHPINFQPDSATLTPAGAATVNKIAGLVRGHSGLALSIEGHVSKAPGSNAQPLSAQRANTVKQAMVADGVGADMLTAKGFGDSKPLPNTPPQSPANRRVDIVVS
ncbi:MAG: OmpA family protein [Sciscionella sp.]|nr:OmpA family protein [Sciscionella sp.]